jgi:hypothetical protein
MEIHTAAPVVCEPISFDVETHIEYLQRSKSPRFGQILA